MANLLLEAHFQRLIPLTLESSRKRVPATISAEHLPTGQDRTCSILLHIQATNSRLHVSGVLPSERGEEGFDKMRGMFESCRKVRMVYEIDTASGEFVLTIVPYGIVWESKSRYLPAPRYFMHETSIIYHISTKDERSRNVCRSIHDHW